MSLLAELHARYRRGGADLPFGDPRRAHGVGMEGYYWRLTDPVAGRVVIALCGVCEAPDGTWALVALAAHPGGHVRHAVVPVASADPARLGVRAGEVLLADERSVRVDLGRGARLSVHLDEPAGWSRPFLGGSGLGQVVPGIGQHWHPHVLGGRATGSAEMGDARWELDGWLPYAEKNWGTHFAKRWWWGQAHGFGEPDVCVAFAGGRVQLGPLAVAPSALAVRIGSQLWRLAPPLARTVAAVGRDAWRLAARQGGLTIEVQAEGGSGAPALLPVPVPAERRVELRSRQWLAGRLAVDVRRGGRLVYRGESELAGLEREVD